MATIWTKALGPILIIEFMCFNRTHCHSYIKSSTLPCSFCVQVSRQIEWSKAHRHWTLDQWKPVLWSDESCVSGILGLANARRTLPVWLRCADCKVWWRRDNGMGLFFRGWAQPFTSSEGKSECFSIPRHFARLPTLWGQFGEGLFYFSLFA